MGKYITINASITATEGNKKYVQELIKELFKAGAIDESTADLILAGTEFI